LASVAQKLEIPRLAWGGSWTLVIVLSLSAATGLVVHVGWRLGENAVVPTSGYVAHTSQRATKKGAPEGLRDLPMLGKVLWVR